MMPLRADIFRYKLSLNERPRGDDAMILVVFKGDRDRKKNSGQQAEQTEKSDELRFCLPILRGQGFSGGNSGGRRFLAFWGCRIVVNREKINGFKFLPASFAR